MEIFGKHPINIYKDRDVQDVVKGFSKTTEQFIEEAKIVHGDKYDYSKDYKNTHEKVCIICPKHGEFLASTKDVHVHRKQGCPKCGDELNGILKKNH